MINSIIRGDLESAYKLNKNKKVKEIYKLVSKEAFKSPNINFYAFFVYMLSKDEWKLQHEDIHYVCTFILSVELCSIEGAYNLAIFHIKKCIEFSEKKEYISYLSHLESVPDTW